MITTSSGLRYCFDCWWATFAEDPDERSDIHLCYSDDCECETCKDEGLSFISAGPVALHSIQR